MKIFPVGAWLLIAVSGCASSPKNPRADLTEERLVMLSEHMEQQRKKVEYLALEVRELKKMAAGNTLKAIKADRAHDVPDSPGKKARSARPKSAARKSSRKQPPASAAIATPEDHLVADSRSEDLHLFYKGLQLKKDGKIDEAISSFRAFSENYPDHVYAERAQFHIVEGLYANKEYQLTVVAANQLLSRHPESPLCADGLYYRALSFRELGEKAEAREGLKELVQRFPKSSRIKVVRVLLSELTETRKASLAPNLLDKTTQ